jgi:hypothetical protein
VSLQVQDLFAWQGFSFPHPQDYAPITLTGTRREGYARLGSSGRLNIQIRWRQTAKPDKLKKLLDTYLDRLAKDAKKAKSGFKSELERVDDSITYRYTGAGQGRGRMFYSDICSRLFFIEVVGGRRDQLLPLFREVNSGFKSTEKGDWEDWSILGLRFRSPVVLTLERKVFQSGRVQLFFKAPGLKLEANRWGFGKQLIGKHGFEEWSKAALALKNEPVSVSEERLEFKPTGWFKPVNAIVSFDEERNQITTLKGQTRKEIKRPQWDWLVK